MSQGLFNQQFFAFLRLIRWPNLLMLGGTQLLASLFLIDRYPWLKQTLEYGQSNLIGIIGATISIAAGGYIINDYYDTDIDLINKPDKMIVGKYIAKRTTLAWYVVLSLGGIATGISTDWQIGVICFFSASLLWLYSAWLKKQPFWGNFIVSLLTAASLLTVWVYYRGSFYPTLVYSVLAFSISLIREIIKDVEDMEGDAAQGCRTIPIILGVKKTKLFLFTLIAAFSVTFLLLGLLILLSPVAFLAVFAPLAYLTFQLAKASTAKDFHFLSTLCKLVMLIGILSMLFNPH